MLEVTERRLTELAETNTQLSEAFALITKAYELRDQFEAKRYWLDLERRRLRRYVESHRRTKSYERGDRTVHVEALDSRISICDRQIARVDQCAGKVDREIDSLLSRIEQG